MRYRIYLIGLILLIGGLVTAQDPLTVGESREITLEANEERPLLLDLVADESVIIEFSPAESVRWDYQNQPDDPDEAWLLVLPGDQTRLMPVSTAVYEISVQNRTDEPKTVTVSLLPIPSESIAIGETITFDEDTPDFIELIFEGRAGEFVSVIPENVYWTIHRANRFNDLIFWREKTWAAGLVLPNDGLYRIDVNLTTVEEGESRRITLGAPEPLTGELSIGETLDATADNTLVEYIIELEDNQHVKATVESEGARAYFLNADGERVGYTNYHGQISPTVAETWLIAPEAGTYTLQITTRITGDLFDGDFTLSTEAVEVIPLQDEATLTLLGQGTTVFLLAEVEAGARYQLTVVDESGVPRPNVGGYLLPDGEDDFLFYAPSHQNYREDTLTHTFTVPEGYTQAYFALSGDDTVRVTLEPVE